jgi:hypothetical protein
MKTPLFFKKIAILGFFFLAATQLFAQLNVTPVSGPNMCDGTAALINPSSVIQSSITWYGNGAIIATNTYQIGNLCPGNYGVSYVQSNPAGGLDSLNTSFFISGGVNPCLNFNVTLTTTPCSTVSSNDGSISPNVTGGTAPYMYMWNQGSVTQNIINLIPGFTYCVNVVDANGCQMNVCDSMTVSGSNTGDTLVVNNANCGPAAVGNFVQLYEDCNFNFNACTSASMTSSTMIGNDTIQTVCTFVDSMGVTIGTYTINYYLPNGMANGCVNLQFILYCSIKSSNSNIKTIVVNDMAQLSGVASVNENTLNAVKYNNPINDELAIQFPTNADYELAIYDLSGKKMYHANFNNASVAYISTAQLKAGSYILTVSTKSEQIAIKLVK